jgi:hypothetical protein
VIVGSEKDKRVIIRRDDDEVSGEKEMEQKS